MFASTQLAQMVTQLVNAAVFRGSGFKQRRLLKTVFTQYIGNFTANVVDTGSIYAIHLG